MLRTRIIPALLLQDESLVKTTQFKDFVYVGDPCNTVRIFNELEVDELVFLDIAVSRKKLRPNFALLEDIASECFMPLGYGGGIASLADAKTIFDIGFEKVIINTHAENNPALITEIASIYGSQAVMVSIDVKRSRRGDMVHTLSGTHNTRRDPVSWAREAERLGAGEILLTSIDSEGTWQGMDLDLVSQVASAVSIPVIAHGGVGNIQHIADAVNVANASAVAIGSMVVFQKKGMGVLVHFPESHALNSALKG